LTNHVTANEIFLAIQDEKKLAKNPGMRLTAEQQEAVEAPLDSPVLVIAGAGSGKTELMSIRVLWLIANSLAKPQDVLGLTFTRKAASELAKRINNGIARLEQTKFWPKSLKDEGYSLPSISTYNSYANSLFRDNALALGYEPDAALLTDSTSYQLAKRVVLRYGNEIGIELDDVDLSLKSAIEGVLKLAAELNDNLATGADVKAEIEKLRAQIAAVPTKKEQLAAVHSTFFSGAFKTDVLVDLAEAYRTEKLNQGFVDYSDQVALAERAVRLFPAAKENERSLHKVVLLDEYQDTSFLQTSFLRALYADHPVFAVGDPNQSIYGWRGASATNLNEFVETFSTKTDQPVKQLKLSTSWRNPKSVLDIANVIAEPLAALAPFQAERGIAKTEVVELSARDGAPEGVIWVDWQHDIVSEAKSVANWIKQSMASEGGQASAAVLFRLKAQMPLFVSELENLGLDVDVVGLGGLLEMPEIIDLVSALKVVHSPSAGGQLVRLLAGPRWRIGAKDIQRLHRYSRALAKKQSEGIYELTQDNLGSDYDASLVDALDILVDSKQESIYGMSDQSMKRLRDAGAFLRKLRSQTGLPLVDFVKHVAAELQLDIEVTANPRRVNPMAHLNSFYSLVAGYATTGSSYLGAFIEWLDFAQAREKLEVPATVGRKGVVQVLTVHAAKGLEWDFVAVPNLIQGDFPKKPRTSRGWMTSGVLPYPLRGDRKSLPELDLSDVKVESQFTAAREAFTDDVNVYLEREERRLAYVAFTRPKRELYLSGSVFKSLSTEQSPSNYLLEVVNTLDPRVKVVNGLEPFVLPDYEGMSNPLAENSLTAEWPSDPLGERHRIRVEAAAHLVSDAKASSESLDAKGADLDLIRSINGDIDALINEVVVRENTAHQVRLPVRIPASRFKDFVKDAEQLAEKFRRPMPEKPYEATMTGTLFHLWVEQRFGLTANTELIDSGESGLERIDEMSPEVLEKLQTNFEASRWARARAREIETEIQVTIGENTFICKIDAVFDVGAEDSELDGALVEIVDWKTGVSPQTAEEEHERALQLALYRMAYSQRHGIDEDKISVCLYYVAENRILRPKVLNSKELIETWMRVLDTFETLG
jgi:DNA helicase-2/ATP-dependent DNA helicase PcrA